MAGQGENKPIPFISYRPKTVEQADQLLADQLYRETGIKFDTTTPAFDYQTVIQEVVDLKNKPFMARLTPYPCVVAELRGAKFEILATYASRSAPKKNGKPALTYHSYFVVRKGQRGASFSDNPTLREFDDFLRNDGKGGRRFTYHDKFSSSSYFVPLNYFRSKGVFNLVKGQSSDKLISIEVEPLKAHSSSSELLDALIYDKADIAAVWDGTKQDFENKKKDGFKDKDEAYRRAAESLRFIPIEQTLPNDLLVVSGFSASELGALRKSIREMPKLCREGRIPPFPDDFECWHLFDEALDAREASEALGDLRGLAAAPPAPVTVRVSMLGGARDEVTQDRKTAYLDAARQAVRVAGTELVLYDQSRYSHVDMEWTLKIIHDGAIELTSAINDMANVKEQTFYLSFADSEEELTRRIVSIIHRRLHRIRYIWPFEKDKPMILRDVGFVPQQEHLWVLPIVWINQKRNHFTPAKDKVFETKILNPNPGTHEFLLDRAHFPNDLEIDPMSNAAFRVVLEPPAKENPLFQRLTAALVSLFVLCGIVSGVDLYRDRRAPKP
jgi:ABC-type phosphate/phosphonate transport system substrate-binding protein